MNVLVLPYKGISPRIHETAYIAPGASVIGDVEIGADSNVWFGAVIRGDVAPVRIGRGTNIQDGTVIHVGEDVPTVIGDDITVGHMALLHACVIEDRAFIGMQACVMDGACVEREAMVAAGSLVTPGKHVRSGELWAGCPAKLMRMLTDEEREGFLPHAAGYVRLAGAYKGA